MTRFRMPWTNDEDLYLLNNYEDMNNRELAKKLDRTVKATEARLHVLGLKRENIFAAYKGEDYITSGTVKEIAEELGIKENTVMFYSSPAHEKRSRNAKKPWKIIKI